MIQPKYNKQNNTILLSFDSIEINLVSLYFPSLLPLYLSFYSPVLYIPNIQISEFYVLPYYSLFISVHILNFPTFYT